MRVRAFLLLSVALLGSAACAEQPGPPTPPDDEATADARLVAEEVSAANAEADGALRLSRLVLGKLGAADVKDQQTAIETITNGAGRPGAGDCVTSIRRELADPGAVYVTFDRCRGPFDAQEITGTLRFAFGKAPGVPGLRVQAGIAPGQTLTVRGASVPEYRVDATLSFPAFDTAVMEWEVAWRRESERGSGLGLRARFRTVLRDQAGPAGEGARECFTTSGRASFDAGARGFSFDVSDYRLCPAPPQPACPEAGGTWSVTDARSLRTVTFQFTGVDAPAGPAGEPRTFLRVVDAAGEESQIDVACGARGRST
ncbi:MAG TPA: hypothetical protein VFS00_04485 [Polyangiaceae bacterium]|nr:hypothetical protein [Polyangiaceae bacterium]